MVNVLFIKNGVVEKNILVSGFTEDATKKGEELFIRECQNNIPLWEQYTEEDIQNALNDGYACEGGYCVYLSHPEIKLAGRR